MNLLNVENLSVANQERQVLKNISFSVKEGECIGLLGPNGAGKTTLLRSTLGLLDHQGHSSLAAMSAAKRAKHTAWLPQSREIVWPIDVETLVMLGRIPHMSGGQRATAEDQRLVDEAIATMGLESFRQRNATQLSGGEQARVLIARALAQDTPLIIADEPAAGLDPAQQILTMQAFEEIAASGRSVIVSLHDLGLAARHCSRLIMLHEGAIIADGSPEEVLTLDRLAQVYGINAFYQNTEEGPIFAPLGVI
jgi:iron complex transport system ATP-binding protein